MLKYGDNGFTMLSDILMKPKFDPKEVARVRDELVGSLQSEKDEPSIIATKAFNELVFKGHPYRRPANGDEKTDRKSTRLNSSHVRISYAVFCLKKKT